MTCSNKSCPIFIVCQKKHKSCQSSTSRVLYNGYRVMAAQEQRMRMASIEFKGDF